MASLPLLVYGPRSLTYDFGSAHPLTPRRFGPGMELLRAIGAVPGLAPEPAGDADLLRVHTARYLAVVRRFSDDPHGPAEAGIGPGDDPAFAGMHEAAAAVAGGSLRATEAILRGDVEHAFHPGGGLHHAMRGHASGFCVYDDPALAIALARSRGRRVLYVDLDVHHGDGVQAIHATDPGVLTLSFHESGRYLFPGSGFVNELGDGEAAGTIVNVPLQPETGEGAWIAAVRDILPSVAAAFGPDLIVSQHGADSHAWDPLAHLRVTTTAMGEAARIVDAVAHLHAGGAWLSTGGGGYDAYRVVPRSWSLVWLAAAHREPPRDTPADWRERWAAESARFHQGPPPEHFHDAPNAGLPFSDEQAHAEATSAETATLVRRLVVPALLRTARERGWWSPEAASHRRSPHAAPPDVTAGHASRGPGSADPRPTLVGPITRARLDRLRLAPRVVPPASAEAGHALLHHAIGAGAIVVVAVQDDVIVGAAVLAARDPGHAGSAPGPEALDLLAVGVAPSHRGRGLGRALLLRAVDSAHGPVHAEVSLAERDPVEPLPAGTRAGIARRLLESAGFSVHQARGALGQADPTALVALRD